MKKRYLIILFLVSGCASPYAGDSDLAVERRHAASAEMLDMIGPDGCSFNSYKNRYYCDKGIDPTEYNKRVPAIREELEQWVYENPWGIANRGDIDNIFFEDLCGCVEENPMLVYCDLKLPKVMIDGVKKEGYRIIESKVNDQYKYIAVK